MPLTRPEAWKLALSLPGAEERPYFGKPSVFIHDRFLTKVHEKEDAMVLYIGAMEMRDMMLEAEPKLFYITDHYRSFPYLLARLSALSKSALKEILVGRAAQLAQMPPPKRPVKKGAKKKVAAKPKMARGKI